MKNEFFWKAGSSEFKHHDPEAVANALEEVRIKHGQLVSAFVVEEARDPENPMHPMFPWDDVEAARLGREAIASRIIRSLCVRVIRVDAPPVETRAYVSMPTPKLSRSRDYRSISSAMADEEGRSVVLRQAWMELRAWKRKYADLSEMALIFDAIEIAERRKQA